MYLTSKQACAYYGISRSTLKRWANSGKVKTVRTPGNHLLYDTSALQNKDKKNYCYCRVSSKDNSLELQQQIQTLSDRFPEYILLQDIGSGMDFNRENFLFLIDECMKGNVNNIVVTDKNVLTRIGFDFIEHICKQNNSQIIITPIKNFSLDKNNLENIISIITGLSK